MKSNVLLNENDPFYKEYRKTYESSFPYEELKPWGMLLDLANSKIMTLHAYSDNDKFVGLTGVTSKNGYTLVNYLAIDQSVRSQGYGSRILHHLLEEYKDQKLFLEVEQVHPCYHKFEQRQRRRNFYLANGMHQTPLYISLYGINMEVLTNGFDMTFKEYKDAYVSYYGEEILDVCNICQLVY